MNCSRLSRWLPWLHRTPLRGKVWRFFLPSRWMLPAFLAAFTIVTTIVSSFSLLSPCCPLGSDRGIFNFMSSEFPPIPLILLDGNVTNVGTSESRPLSVLCP